MSVCHVIGAGLAGLTAAVTLAQAGRPVTLWEAGQHAGGRCRSWFEPAVDAVIDNGAHLALSGNTALTRYLTLTGAEPRMVAITPAALPFTDLDDGACWTLRPGAAMLTRRHARPPGVAAWRLARDAARLLAAPAGATVGEILGASPAFDRLWRPLTVSALNLAADEAAATLLAAVCRETLLRGEAACRPLSPRVSLDDALIQPGLAALARSGGRLHPGARVRGLNFTDDCLSGLAGPDIRVASCDRVILAVPAWAAAELLPGLPTPPAGPAIVNVHFRLPPPLAADRAFAAPLLGLTGGRVDWLFRRGDVLSATISAADDLAARSADDIAQRVWRDIGRAAPAPALTPPPPYRVVKERRATFAATPAALALRPPLRTRWRNLFLAGDWVDNGLPSTMEGAIRSGFAAAAAILGN